MKQVLAVVTLASAALLTGCASTPPQRPVMLSKKALQPSTRVGIAMSPLPKVDTSFPGAGCLLCLAAASATNSALTTHTQTLPADDIARLKNDLAEALRKKGYQPIVIDEAIKVGDLPKGEEGTNRAKHDFSSLRSKYHIDKLVMIEVTGLGISRNYSAYIPNGAPQGVVNATGYMINLNTNTFEWFLPVHQAKAASGAWDEPPAYPGLTNAYFQAVESTRDAFLKPFGN